MNRGTIITKNKFENLMIFIKSKIVVLSVVNNLLFEIVCFIIRDFNIIFATT